MGLGINCMNRMVGINQFFGRNTRFRRCLLGAFQSDFVGQIEYIFYKQGTDLALLSYS